MFRGERLEECCQPEFWIPAGLGKIRSGIYPFQIVHYIDYRRLSPTTPIITNDDTTVTLFISCYCLYMIYASIETNASQLTDWIDHPHLHDWVATCCSGLHLSVQVHFVGFRTFAATFIILPGRLKFQFQQYGRAHYSRFEGHVSYIE